MQPLIVNFGGPRNLDEIASFLISLLSDQDVIRTPFPAFFHKILFTRIAKKRAVEIRPDYEGIGGKSPIYEDTEEMAKKLSSILKKDVWTFHRYLPSTHEKSLQTLRAFQGNEIRIFPLFPQFSFATTGSIARFFKENLPPEIFRKMRWIASYAHHPSFIDAHVKKIQEFLEKKNIREEEIILFYSAHGVPKKFILDGDIYQSECETSFRKIAAHFPKALNKLAFQSKFGKGEWLRPYTDETCEEVLSWNEGREHVLFIPLSFTSDHIETLFEIEKLYLPIIRKKGLHAHRLDALNLDSDWMQGIGKIFQNSPLVSTEMLIR